MEFLESLDNGSCINVSGHYYLLTQDRKLSGNRLCISLKDGSQRWFEPSKLVEIIDIFTLDKDSNILAIRPREKQNANDNNDT